MTKTIATDGHVSVETSISADEKTPPRPQFSSVSSAV